MDYQVFKQKLRDLLTVALTDDYRVELTSVRKNNGLILDAVSIIRRDNNVSPTIYMSSLYERYQNGDSMEDIAKWVLDYYFQHIPKEDKELMLIMDPEKVSPHIVYRLVNYEKNRTLLDNIPYRRFLDLALIYCVDLETENIGKASAIVRNDLLCSWEMDQERLDRLAAANTPKILPYCFLPLWELMEKFRKDQSLTSEDIETVDRDIPLYVLTNKEFRYGAYWMTQNSLLEEISERLGDDLIVLPSSVHECMIVPGAGNDRKMDDFASMVKEINAAEVPEQDILADSVYFYRRGSGMLELCA